MICKNCGNIVEGKFCSECGQSIKVDRINFKLIASEIPNSVFQLNNGFLYTIKELTIRPGHTIREYVGFDTNFPQYDI